MQPVKLVIPGNFWDTQIYAGRLYLFGRSGEIQAINWDSLIGTWQVAVSLELALRCAFRQSDYLYGDMSDVLRDQEVREVMTQKFARLADMNLEISVNQMQEHMLGQQDNPIPSPHTDSDIYLRQLYISSKSGVFRVTCNGLTRHPVGTRVKKLWDAPVLGLAASYSTLALAAGSEGLFEQSVYHSGLEQGGSAPSNVCSSHCVDCNWTFHNIYASSQFGVGFLASYHREQIRDEDGKYHWLRHFERIFRFDEVFESNTSIQRPTYSWASQDKICMASNGHLRVVRYNPWASDVQSQFESAGSIDLEAEMGSIVSAVVSLFGTVIEFDRGIVVLPSEGAPIRLPGEPVNWRTFPKSHHYENQLHVIYGDRLEIYSFNQDYFVDQGEKVSGTRFWGARRRNRGTL